MKTIYRLGYEVDTFPKGVSIIDCRVIENPFRKSKFVVRRREIVRKDPMFEKLVTRAIILLEGKDRLIIACSFGKDRSGAVVEEVVKRIKEKVNVIKGVRSCQD